MHTRTKDAETIRLESLAAAAACLEQGCELIEVRALDNRRCEFLIRGDDADIVASDYICGKLEGNLRDFMRQFDRLRTRIREVRK